MNTTKKLFFGGLLFLVFAVVQATVQAETNNSVKGGIYTPQPIQTIAAVKQQKDPNIEQNMNSKALIETIPDSLEKSMQVPSKSEKTDSSMFEDSSFALPSLHYSVENSIASVKAGNVTKPEFKAVQKLWQRQTYKVPTEADLNAAYEVVKNNIQIINGLLAKSDAQKRQAWIQFLHWDVLHPEQPVDSAALKEVLTQLNCGGVGLELKFFVRLRDSIEYFLALEAQMQVPQNAETAFKAGRKRVEKLLVLASQNPSSEIQRAVEDVVNWMERNGQASEAVAATRSLWSKSNIIMNVDSSIFERYGSSVIEEENAIRNQMQEAYVQGTTAFSGNLQVKPVPNPNKIQLGITLDGESDTRTNAYAGPAIISSRAKSVVAIQKNIFFDVNGLEADDAQVKISTNSQIENVQDRMNRPMVQNVAARRAYARKPQMEQQATAQSAQQLRKRFNEALDVTLTDWNKRYYEMLNRQLLPRGLEPVNTRTWSDEEGVHAQTTVSCRESMGAAILPTAEVPKTDVQIAVHETAIQEILSGYFSGLCFNEHARKQIQATSPDWMQKLLTVKEGTDVPTDWSLRFAQTWPVTASFEDGKIKICVHCTQLIYEGKVYPAVNITMIYSIESRQNAIVLVRQGGIEILPPNFNPEVQKRLPSSMVSLRRVMGKRLEKELQPEIVLQEQKVIKEVPKDAKYAKATSRFQNLMVQPVYAKSENGWLQVGFNLVDQQ